eukprot:6467240-Prymnesium_polylepis.1
MSSFAKALRGAGETLRSGALDDAARALRSPSLARNRWAQELGQRLLSPVTSGGQVAAKAVASSKAAAAASSSLKTRALKEVLRACSSPALAQTRWVQQLEKTLALAQTGGAAAANRFAALRVIAAATGSTIALVRRVLGRKRAARALAAAVSQAPPGAGWLQLAMAFVPGHPVVIAIASIAAERLLLRGRLQLLLQRTLPTMLPPRPVSRRAVLVDAPGVDEALPFVDSNAQNAGGALPPWAMYSVQAEAD